MTSLLAHIPSLLRRGSIAALLLASLASLPSLGQAQQAQGGAKANKHFMSDKLSEELGKVRPLSDAKKWDEAIVMVDGLLKQAAPDSFDQVQLLNYKVQFLINKGDLQAVIEPLEKSLKLSQQFNYLDAGIESELTYLLAQIYFQEAAAKDRTLEQQKYNFTKAAYHAERYLSKSTKVNPDSRVFYASILYYMAQLDPKNLDLELLKKAEDETRKCLLMSTRPKDQHQQLLLAILTQRTEYVKAAEVLELMVKQNPNSKTFWQQLAAMYLSLASDKDPKVAYANNVRAIVTIERAQAAGHMNTSKDNFNLVGIYINIQQYEQAALLLESGLRNGKIDSEQRNWEYLAMSYQQMNKELKAIDVLKEATKLFPTSGQLNFQIAQYYYSIDKPEDAYREGMIALSKGNLERPWTVYSYIAYWAYECRKLDEALAAANKAYEYPESAKDNSLKRVKQVIEESIKEREFTRAQIEGQQQPKSEEKKQEPKTAAKKA
ncbi:MAG: hypothetical protein HZA31_09010 [Opitutae bacterium]|nr:hypothetical protein [Opitutae bacterium]